MNKYILLFTIALAACENPMKKAVRKVEYSAYELIGVQKRDLLKTRVEDAREEQKESSEDFRDALQKLKDVTGFEGGKLEKKYDALKISYDRSFHQAEDVHKSVRRVETVAKDLFEEWEKEIRQIETRSLQERSRKTLAETKTRYEGLHRQLKGAEARLEPILKKLNDYVLFLKHNLNAKAIGSLKTESVKIQGDIETLVDDLNRSIASADEFVKTMESADE